MAVQTMIKENKATLTRTEGLRSLFPFLSLFSLAPNRGPSTLLLWGLCSTSLPQSLCFAATEDVAIAYGFNAIRDQAGVDNKGSKRLAILACSFNEKDYKKTTIAATRTLQMIKKAKELAILCATQVGLVISSSTRKLYEYANTSFTKVKEHHHFGKILSLPQHLGSPVLSARMVFYQGQYGDS
ncbi:hypothetical protein JHK84_042941 [Glycine max]|nr:hypothetical protein JHK84_042941 [Glycine max]